MRRINNNGCHQEITDLEEIPDFHSVCEELEELNSWMNRLESIVDEVEKPIDVVIC